ncbi:hypothetical protein Tco_0588681 [Tanacetum coccineum]
MRIDELYKLCGGTLNDVWTALDDRLKGIWMKYLPKTIWRQSDRDKAGAMIQAIDKWLKTGRIMWSLEKFVDKMDSMHSTLSMYYDYDAHVKGELLVMMKNSQSVNLLIFISNTLIELFNDFGFDCDGIPERPTMYLNLWSYKVVRYRYSNPMIQPEPEGSTQGYPLDSVEVLRSILMDSKVTPTKHGRMTKPYSSPRFIANYFNTGYIKMEVKVASNDLRDALSVIFGLSVTQAGTAVMSADSAANVVKPTKYIAGNSPARRALAEASKGGIGMATTSMDSGPKPAQLIMKSLTRNSQKSKPLDFKGTEGVDQTHSMVEKMDS